MARFRVRFGRRGSRISNMAAMSIVDARNKFKKLHRGATIDSISLIKRRRE